MKLDLIELQLLRQKGSLVLQVEAALAVHGHPLRWAITAVVPGPLGPTLHIEAVVQG